MRLVDVNEIQENSEMLSAFDQQMQQLYLDWIAIPLIPGLPIF